MPDTVAGRPHWDQLVRCNASDACKSLHLQINYQLTWKFFGVLWFSFNLDISPCLIYSINYYNLVYVLPCGNNFQIYSRNTCLLKTRYRLQNAYCTSGPSIKINMKMLLSVGCRTKLPGGINTWTPILFSFIFNPAFNPTPAAFCQVDRHCLEMMFCNVGCCLESV